MQFTIRDLTTYPDMLKVHQVQQEIWGTQGTNLGLYPPVLNTAAKNGGVVLGAFDRQTDQMIAFLFGFLGKSAGGPLKLCSQTMGVLPQWRNLGVGEALKQAQRERVLAQGLALITWTYDPLETRNAYLNLHKLRGICRHYWRDVYGSNFGTINAGLPSDRLEVEWWVRSDRIIKGATPAAKPEAPTPIFELAGQNLNRHIVKTNFTLDAPQLCLDMLHDIQALKTHNMALAQAWRMAVREALEHYFAQDYVITDFRTSGSDGERKNQYLLEKLTPALQIELGIEG